MKRTLTSIAAASVALGTMAAPVAFASTSNGLTWNKYSISANGYTANPEGFAAMQSGTETTFLPIYYVMQALKGMGYTVSWTGNALSVVTPNGVKPDFSNLQLGSGNVTIFVNGTPVKMVDTMVEGDPASGGKIKTSYMPIFYINQILTDAGVTPGWNGSGWSMTPPTPVSTSQAQLSALTTTGASSGTGAASSPAISLNNAAITVSTTLTDANGNPLTNTAVTFNVSNYGNYPSTLPTVANASGTVISGTAQSNAEQYTAYTGSNGVASISISNPGGQTNAYEVVATAPYSNGSGAVSSAPAYVEFVSNNTAGIAPYAGVSNPFNGTLGTPVPISVTLPPNSAGQPQANVLVTLTTNIGSFVSSSGAILGKTIQVSTNSSGVAQTYLSSSTTGTGSVTVSGLPTGINAPSAAYFSFAQGGVPAKIGNISVSTNNPNIGSNVVVSGQLQDASGNPVPNGQVLVTSPNNGSNDLAYVSGTTTTKFPLISSVAVGTPATSAYGDLVTADSAGNFTVTMTDPRVETQYFYIYPVSNGEVSSATPLNGSTPSNNNTLNFQQSTDLATISVGAFDAYVAGNSNTTLTGLSASIDAGGTLPNDLLTTAPGEVATVYAEPQNSAGHHGGALNSTALTYTLSANNGGLIYAINGVALSSPAAAVTLAYNGAGGFTANGTTVAALTSPANASDFSVGVVNSNGGNTTLTISSGSVSSTATISFGGGAPAQAASFSPGSVIVNPGQQQQVTFQVQDANGNPVANTATNILMGASAGFFVTQVNGVTLQENVNMGTSGSASYTTEATPIPLGSYNSSMLNYSVGIPGVASWTNGNNYFTVYSGANGDVTLTLQAGGLNYPTVETGGNTANPNNYAPGVSGSGWLGFYSNSSGDTNVPMYVYQSTSTPAATYSASITPSGGSADSFSGSLLGQINW